MIFREATAGDIKEMQRVRNSVTENTLSNPALVTDADVEEYITSRGKGWVCEVNGKLAGFSIVDMKENNVWALFVHPDYAAKGIGKRLHDLMLNWYFDQTDELLWLGTAPDTRAEKFYALQGWQKAGMHGTKEVKFEMSKSSWIKRPGDK